MILLRIYGIVQGVGFRPFIWRLAKSYDLKGYVKNKGGYVEVALEGNISNIDNFQKDLETQLPEQAHIDFIDRVKEIDRNFKDFSIAPSEETSFKALSGIPPDIATCDACKRELFDPNDRRHLYPFINCTDCGPRFTIISNVPYDRAKTSMSEYPMCQSCEVEYNDPRDRRYHAEPLACPIKGPNYSLIVNEGLIEKDPIKKGRQTIG